MLVSRVLLSSEQPQQPNTHFYSLATSKFTRSTMPARHLSRHKPFDWREASSMTLPWIASLERWIRNVRSTDASSLAYTALARFW